MPIDAITDADEAFLTSTVREVQTITEVDGDAIPHAPGPVTTRLAKEFKALVDRDLDPSARRRASRASKLLARSERPRGGYPASQ